MRDAFLWTELAQMECRKQIRMSANLYEHQHVTLMTFAAAGTIYQVAA
jgi:hypothetical protein